jgi:hypothetical protein
LFIEKEEGEGEGFLPEFDCLRVALEVFMFVGETRREEGFRLAGEGTIVLSRCW